MYTNEKGGGFALRLKTIKESKRKISKPQYFEIKFKRNKTNFYLFLHFCALQHKLYSRNNSTILVLRKFMK